MRPFQLALAAAFLLAPAAAPQDVEGWKLVWSDEFDYDGQIGRAHV